MEVLEKALQVFWLRGYEATTLDDLEEVLGLDKSSIYAKFGTKTTLFERTIKLYSKQYMGYANEALGSSTAMSTAKTYLEGAAHFFSDRSHPTGCMLVKNSNTFNQSVASKKQLLESQFQARFDLAILQGDLPQNTDTQQLAQFLNTVHQGMSLQATTGANKAELLATAALAINIIEQTSTNNSYA